jgi:hypothetical protein
MRRRIVLISFVLLGCGGTDFKGFDAGDASTDATTEGGAQNEAGSDGSMDGASCSGSHPIVDAGARYCNPGDCYCMPNDKCLAMTIASTCCTVAPKCN